MKKGCFPKHFLCDLVEQRSIYSELKGGIDMEQARCSSFDLRIENKFAQVPGFFRIESQEEGMLRALHYGQESGFIDAGVDNKEFFGTRPYLIQKLYIFFNLRNNLILEKKYVV